MSDWNPNYGGNKQFKKKNHFSFSKDTNVIVARILPQPKGAAKNYNPQWSKFHSVHFGYKNTEGKFRMFESPLVRDKNDVVTQADPALDRLNDLKNRLAEAKATNNEAMVSRLNALCGMKGVYNLDNNHHMNVMLLDGSIGELKIKHKAKLKLDKEIERIRTESGNEIDPLSFENGRFFVFTRTGTGNQTDFDVKEYTEKLDIVNVGKVDRPVVSKVTPDIKMRLETEGFDLNTLFTKLTANEVLQIVKESDLSTGKSPACDRFFDAKWKAEREAKKNSNNESSLSEQLNSKSTVATPLEASTNVETKSNVPAPTATVTVTTQASGDGAQAPVTSKTSSFANNELNDDEWLKQLESELK